MKSMEAKLVVLGSQGVGKTSIIMQYVGNLSQNHVSPTIGASFFTCKAIIDDYRVKLQVWDTAGQERFRSMAPMYYRNANAAILVFDITSEDSFEAMQSWVSELQKNVEGKLVLCVVANKCDLQHDRTVSLQASEEYASEIGALFHQTSALENQGIQEAFFQIAKALINNYEEGQGAELNVLDTLDSNQIPKDHILLHSGSSPGGGQPSGSETGRGGRCC